MQNKKTIKVFAILFAIVCLYQLSFTWKVNQIEDDAANYALNVKNNPKNIKKAEIKASKSSSEQQRIAVKQSELNQIEKAAERSYLDSMNNVKVLGPYTYFDCKQRELNLGLDLKGGMNVTLEVRVVDVLRSLAAANKNDEEFIKAITNALKLQEDSQDDFLTLFSQEYEKISPKNGLANIFLTQFDEGPNKINLQSTNEDVVSVLKIEVDAAIERSFEILRTRIDRFGVTQPNIQKLGGGQILVELPGIKDVERAKKLLQSSAQLEFWETYDLGKIGGRDKSILTSSFEKANNFIVNSNLSSSANQKDSSLVSKQPLLSLIKQNQLNKTSQGPVIGYVEVKDTSKLTEYLSSTKSFFPNRLFLTLSVKAFKNKKDNSDPKNGLFELIALKSDIDGNPAMFGDVVDDAKSEISGKSAEIIMDMTETYRPKWASLTERNKGKSIAIVLDGLVYSHPTVQNKIEGGRSNITGDFSLAEARDLANILKAGKLPAPAKIINEEVVGPSLGKEAISAGMNSFLYALIFVLVYIAFYYGRAGIVSNIALVVNIFFIFGVLASLGAVLTLPGIAGIILTIGMSIDANVLIYERVREEMTNGKGLKLAISDGYKSAYSSIIDANVTTLLTGIILYTFGSGPVKGFATTLVIGILTSLFCAIFITRLIISSRLDKGKKVSFSTKVTKGAFKKINIDFVGKRKIFYFISSAVILIGAYSLSTNWLQEGVDFSGGRTYVIRFDKEVDNEKLKSSLAEQFVDEKGLVYTPEVKTFGPNNQVKVTTSYLIKNDDVQTADSIVRMKLFNGCKYLLPNDFFDEVNQVQSNIDQLKKQIKNTTNDSELSDLKLKLDDLLVNKKNAERSTYDIFFAMADKNSDNKETLYVQSSQKVGPTIADDIKKSAFWAVLISLVIIFLYILLRFRKWQFSLGAVVAAFHDVFIVMSLFSLFYGVLPFSLEIDQAFVAAILTIIGYSLNDTVVVFDRVREYLVLNKKKKVHEILNKALNSTLSRTINTSLTTFFVLLVIFIFGGEVIRGFMFALMVGVLVGTYSSLFIASPIMLDTIKRKE